MKVVTKFGCSYCDDGWLEDSEWRTRLHEFFCDENPSSINKLMGGKYAVRVRMVGGNMVYGVFQNYIEVNNLWTDVPPSSMGMSDEVFIANNNRILIGYTDHIWGEGHTQNCKELAIPLAWIETITILEPFGGNDKNG